MCTPKAKLEAIGGGLARVSFILKGVMIEHMTAIVNE